MTFLRFLGRILYFVGVLAILPILFLAIVWMYEDDKERA